MSAERNRSAERGGGVRGHDARERERDANREACSRSACTRQRSRWNGELEAPGAANRERRRAEREERDRASARRDDRGAR